MSLQTITSLKGHNEEVKCLDIKGDYLYSAGKATNNGASIFIWDIRKLQSPVQEKENSLDIFSLLVHEDILYYGSRNHRVGRINLKNFESMRTYEPPHFDSVTSLTRYKNSIISGSRDKNMRRWGLVGDNSYPTILSAHTDWVNCLATDPYEKFIYSAGKEGKVRVWKGARTMRCVGEMSGHLSSVNCIYPLDSHDSEVISGGTDKCLKIWRLIEDQVSSESDEEC